jgi:predicted signal transduction protein with EAL and GGDEF domain
MFFRVAGPQPGRQRRHIFQEGISAQIQDLARLSAELLEIKTKTKIALEFHVRPDVIDGKVAPSEAAIKDNNVVLEDAAKEFRLS